MSPKELKEHVECIHTTTVIEHLIWSRGPGVVSEATLALILKKISFQSSFMCDCHIKAKSDECPLFMAWVWSKSSLILNSSVSCFRLRLYYFCFPISLLEIRANFPIGDFYENRIVWMQGLVCSVCSMISECSFCFFILWCSVFLMVTATLFLAAGSSQPHYYTRLLSKLQKFTHLFLLKFGSPISSVWGWDHLFLWVPDAGQTLLPVLLLSVL